MICLIFPGVDILTAHPVEAAPLTEAGEVAILQPSSPPNATILVFTEYAGTLLAAPVAESENELLLCFQTSTGKVEIESYPISNLSTLCVASNAEFAIGSPIWRARLQWYTNVERHANTDLTIIGASRTSVNEKVNELLCLPWDEVRRLLDGASP
ncbi:hypothetical protein ACFL1U_01875 [Patescibacteria group bacterium]